jgi:predicted nucleic acid-binding protein
VISTAPPVLFDTNALWNFAVVRRMDVIETRYGDRACWTETVRDEIHVAVGYEPLLTEVEASTWLRGPLKPRSPKCLQKVATIQRILAAPGDPPSRHLGEAETIHVIEHELDGDAWFVTDDNMAVDLAVRRGIRVLRTDDVLRECFEMFDLRCPEPFDLLVQMAAAGRDGVRLPRGHSDIC